MENGKWRMNFQFSTVHLYKGGYGLEKLLNVHREVLDNGLEIIVVKKESQLMSVNLGIKIGSIYENDGEKGISHFIEHMIFKGTKKRSNAELMDDIESLGGDIDAYTDNNSTVLSVSALHTELENSLELLSDMVINSEFDKKQIDKERSVILSEIKSSYDDIEDFSYRKINEVAFEGNNLMYDVLGTEESVKNFKRADLISYYEKYYSPNNSSIVIVSPYDKNYVVDLVKKYFSLWKRKMIEKSEFNTILNKPFIKKIDQKDSEQSTILYLYTFKNLSKKEELALDVLNYKLGDNSNSVLFKELRENRGLCYEVYSSLTEIDDLKLLYIYTSVNPEDVEEAIEVIEGCVEEFKKRNISMNEGIFKLIKKVYKTNLATTFETCDNIGDFLLQYALKDEDIDRVFEDIKEIDSMSVEEIYDVGEKILNSPSISIVLGKE